MTTHFKTDGTIQPGVTKKAPSWHRLKDSRKQYCYSHWKICGLMKKDQTP